MPGGDNIELLEENQSKNNNQRMKTKETKERKCNICGLIFSTKTSKEHQKLQQHIEAQKSKHGEKECKICKEKYITGYGKEHRQTKEHKVAADIVKAEEKKLRKKPKGSPSARIFTQEVILEDKETEKRGVRDTYFIRPGQALPEQNQEYVNTLTVFFALRYCFNNGSKNFNISLNNKDWDKFGDIVFESINQQVVEIQAIQCKQIQNRNSITKLALGAESGKFSIKEQCEVLKSLRNHSNYPKAAFKLFTVSGFQMEKTHFHYDVFVNEWIRKEQNVLESMQQNLLKTKEEILLKSKEQNVLKSKEQSLLKSEEQSLSKSKEQNVLKSKEQSLLKSEEQSLLKSEEQSLSKSKEQNVLKSKELSLLKSEEQSLLKSEGQSLSKIKELNMWKGREVLIEQFKRKSLLNTTDDPDDIYMLKIVTEKEEEELKSALRKLRFYVNQKKITGLKYLIWKMLEDQFTTSRDITEDLVKYIGTFFRTEKTSKKNDYNFKMRKTDFLQKLSELLLNPFQVFPDTIIAGIKQSLWVDTIKSFDIVLIKDNVDIVKKVYATINQIVTSKTQTVLKIFNKVTVEKKEVADINLSSEIFDGYPYDTRDVPLTSLYQIFWKSGLTPLVLKAENEQNLALILKLISYLKSEDISLKFIISTNLKLGPGDFPDNLKVFANWRNLDEGNLTRILDNQIKVLDFDVPLKKINDCNLDFLEKLTPDALLNVLCKDYLFRDSHVALSEQIVDNTLVMDDGIIEELKRKLGDGEITKRKPLTYLVNVKGRVSRIEVPPEL